MAPQPNIYDVAIVGGGLAGLSLSIQLAREDYKVILFEKEKYPFHKVCGEYISMESWDFIESLGIPLGKLELPVIDKLIVSSPGGKEINAPLDMGGFGISRYTLDKLLSDVAKQCGVEIKEETKVDDIIFDDGFTLQTRAGSVKARMVAGAFGKRSNLDIKWSRSFTGKKKNKLNNFIGVKYHVRTAFPQNTIALHNFKNGYCGISRIEEGKYCLCYLTRADNLLSNNNSIQSMEKNVLEKNPHLQKIFNNSEFLYEVPVTISQISFDKKSQVENHVLMIGDAASMITPLCGNGMSMALHGSKIAYECIDLFLKNKMNRDEMEARYQTKWKKEFSGRLRMGRVIQSFFGRTWLTNMFISTGKLLPFITKRLIRSTHGEPF